MAVTLHANSAFGFLASPVAPGDTNIVLQLGQGVLFPSLAIDEQFYVTVENRAIVGALEIMLVTTKAVDSFTVVRAQQGTLAQSFAAGTSVSNRVTAEFLNGIDSRIVDATETSGAAAVAAASAVVAADAATAAVALKANVDSQTFTGVPAAPTAAPGTSTTQIATTAFVGAAVAAGGGGGGGGAPVNSPAFTGDPTAPTPAVADNDTSIATTAFVNTALAGAGFAPIANPVFTGVQTGTTASQGTNTTRLATTAFVVAANALQANLAGATFTGAVAVPNVTYPNNSTLAANTAYVTAAIAGIVPSLDTEGVQDVVGGMVTGSTQTNITVTYNDATGKLDFVAAAGGGGGGDVTGPASSVADAPAIFNGATGKVIKQTTYDSFKTSLAITKADLALGNVDNTSDASKPVSTATQTALNTKGDVSGPASSVNDAPALFSGTTGKLIKTTTYPAFKTSLGLGSVDNTADASKPVSTAQAAAIAAKGDVSGPASSAADAPAIFSGTTGKLLKTATYASFKTSLAITKADLGLGSVDNTADASKPVSTAQQAALDLKANLAGPTTFTGVTSATTPTAGDSTTKVATTAFVTAAVAAVGSGSVDVLTGILALDEADSTAAATSLLQGVSSPDGVLAFESGALANKPFLPAPGVVNRVLTYDAAGLTKLATYTEMTAVLDAATATLKGTVELATTAEVSAGTDTGRAVTPAALAASNLGVAIVELMLAGNTEDLTTGDGKDIWIVPAEMDGWKIESVAGHVITAGTTGASTFMVANTTDAVDVLSAPLSVASAGTNATGGTVNASNNTLQTNDRIRGDVDSVSTTKPKGGRIYLKCRKS